MGPEVMADVEYLEIENKIVRLSEPHHYYGLTD
jgi:hypothetical protein